MNKKFECEVCGATEDENKFDILDLLNQGWAFKDKKSYCPNCWEPDPVDDNRPFIVKSK